MKQTQQTVLALMIATLSIVLATGAPAMADNSKKAKKPATHSTTADAAEAAGGMPEAVSSPDGQREHKPGPAWRTIGGTVKQIKGNTYTVEDYEGNQVQLYVGQETKHLRQKRVGDTVRAEITRGGFANSIQ